MWSDCLLDLGTHFLVRNIYSLCMRCYRKIQRILYKDPYPSLKTTFKKNPLRISM